MRIGGEEPIRARSAFRKQGDGAFFRSAGDVMDMRDMPDHIPDPGQGLDHNRAATLRMLSYRKLVFCHPAIKKT